MEESNRPFQHMMIRHGIPELLWMIVRECNARHEHYAPSESVFSIWADVLTKHIPEMIKEAKQRYG